MHHIRPVIGLTFEKDPSGHHQIEEKAGRSGVVELGIKDLRLDA